LRFVEYMAHICTKERQRGGEGDELAEQSSLHPYPCVWSKCVRPNCCWGD